MKQLILILLLVVATHSKDLDFSYDILCMVGHQEIERVFDDSLYDCYYQSGSLMCIDINEVLVFACSNFFMELDFHDSTAMEGQ